jgi:hypothetical protein
MEVDWQICPKNPGYFKMMWVIPDINLSPEVKKNPNFFLGILNFGFDITFDLIKIELIEPSNLNENVRLDEFYNFDVGLKIQFSQRVTHSIQFNI